MRSLAVSDWVFEHAEQSPTAPAVDSPAYRLSYRSLAERIDALASELLAQGIEPGDRVLVALPNLPAAVVVSLAVQHIGAVSVEVSRDLGVEQLAVILGQSGARGIAFAAQDARKLAPLVRSVGACSALVVQRPDAAESLRSHLVGLPLTRLSEDGRLLDAERPGTVRCAQARDPASLTQLLYTSGSTGQPRGVMQTIENVAANTRSIVQYLGLSANDRAMLILPLAYCYGKSVLQTHLFVGGSVFLDPRFTYPHVVLEAITTERCTGFAGVPLTFELLQRHAKPDPGSLPSLRYVTQAGGALTRNTADWVRKAFEPAKLFIMYGQTEATARLAYVPPERTDKPGSIGVPIPDVELEIVDEAGAALPPGVQGQLVARGPNITPGYYQMPAETAQILRRGWLWTGDIGYRDEDGFFYLVGREREILKVGGHRVSPAQIEAELAICEGVSEVAVVGAPDPLMGQVPAALVVTAPDVTLSEFEIRKFCAARLPPYMVPRLVAFASALPRGSSGKLLRAEVTELFAGMAQGRERT